MIDLLWSLSPVVGLLVGIQIGSAAARHRVRQGQADLRVLRAEMRAPIDMHRGVDDTWSEAS